MRPHTARPPACRTAHSPLQSQTSHFRRFILLLFYPIWFSHHPFDDPMDDLMASYARDIFWKPCLIHSLPISRLFLKQDGTAYQLKCPCHFAKAPGVLHLLINSFISSKMTRFLTKVWSEGIWITSKLKRGIFFFFFGFTIWGSHSIVLFHLTVLLPLFTENQIKAYCGEDRGVQTQSWATRNPGPSLRGVGWGWAHQRGSLLAPQKWGDPMF